MVCRSSIVCCQACSTKSLQVQFSSAAAAQFTHFLNKSLSSKPSPSSPSRFQHQCYDPKNSEPLIQLALLLNQFPVSFRVKISPSIIKLYRNIIQPWFHRTNHIQSKINLILTIYLSLNSFPEKVTYPVFFRFDNIPSSACCNPAMIFRSVVLPEPFLPIKPILSPGLTEKFIPSKRYLFAKCIDKFELQAYFF